jgi:hypothetical protein
VATSKENPMTVHITVLFALIAIFLLLLIALVLRTRL